MGPSIKRIQETLRLLPEAARELKVEIERAYARQTHDAYDKVLELANRLLEAHGVEAIEGEDYIDRYYGNIVALYVNMGDTYVGTILFNTITERFTLEGWDDFVERNEKRYHIR